jgi:Domain of unknown function (DUF4145)
MKCPHCGINFHSNWVEDNISRDDRLLQVNECTDRTYWVYRSAHCPACKDLTISIGYRDFQTQNSHSWRQIYPVGANRGPVPPEVPTPISEDYIEACNVLPVSAKASATLSRRCLQNILHENGYRGRDLAAEIGLLLNETDPKKGIPERIRSTVDSIRNFGNFSAHPIDDKTTLQIIDVEPEEAEWCLEIIEELFGHFYVGPAIAKAKKASLDAKLAAAGKPRSR